MKIRFVTTASALALCLSTAASLASPCSKEMAETEAAFNAKLNAAAEAGPSAPESSLATLHHQPTPGTVARAEARLGDISSENAEAVTESLRLAHAADEIGDFRGCLENLAMARQALNK